MTSSVAYSPVQESLRELWQVTAETMVASGAQQIPSPSLYRQRVCGKGSNRLSFHDLILPGIAQVRCTEIYGPKISILNVMIFPLDARKLPVFAMEYVLFGDIVRAAILDLQPLAAEARSCLSCNDAMDHLYATYGHLSNMHPLPEWCEEHFTEKAIVHRGESSEALPELLDAYRQLLAAYTHQLSNVLPSEGSGDDTVLRDYKQHHVTHSPGRPFLARVYGEEWMETFLNEYMYG